MADHDQQPTEETVVVDISSITDPSEVDEYLNQLFADYIDTNHEIIKRTRAQAQGMQQLFEFHSEQAERCEEIIALMARGAALVAGAIGDAIVNEWLGNGEGMEDGGDGEEFAEAG